MAHLRIGNCRGLLRTRLSFGDNTRRCIASSSSYSRYNAPSLTTELRPLITSSSRIYHNTRCLTSASSKTYHNTRTRIRTLTTTSLNSYAPQKTVEQVKSRSRSGIFSVPAAIIFILAGAGLIVYFKSEKARLDRKRIADASKGMGKPKVGGVFSLVDQDGRNFRDEDMKGGFSIVYFGFTHCPDICPEELDKLAQIIDMVNSSQTSRISTSAYTDPSRRVTGISSALLPLFITCDPARDTPSILKQYLGEFHPAIVGLTGTWDNVKDVCKKYRVYFSTPQDIRPGEDYLVDHSIYFYVMDPEGEFIEAIGRQHSAERAAQIIIDHMGDWHDGKKKGD